MTIDTLTASAMPAESLAGNLSHWQLMDIVFVYEHGNIQVGAARPWKPLDQLIQWGVLKYATWIAKNLILIPGHRFQAVYSALQRSGRIAKHERAVL